MEFAIIWLLCGVAAAVVANSRGANGCLWFGLGVILGPLGFALAFLNSLPACPFCRKGVAREAVKCPYCQSDLRERAASLAPPSPPPIRPPIPTRARVSPKMVVTGLVVVLLAAFGLRWLRDDVLPDVKELTERRANTRDEYARITRKFGKPDSLVLIKNDQQNLTITSRIARYDGAHLKIIFVPVGCFDAYERAADLTPTDASRYPTLAQDLARRWKACAPSSDAWTVVRYVDSRDEGEVEVGLARIFLDHRTGR